MQLNYADLQIWMSFHEVNSFVNKQYIAMHVAAEV